MLAVTSGKIQLVIIVLLSCWVASAVNTVPGSAANRELSYEEAIHLLYACLPDEHYVLSPNRGLGLGHSPTSINPTAGRQFANIEEGQADVSFIPPPDGPTGGGDVQFAALGDGYQVQWTGSYSATNSPPSYYPFSQEHPTGWAELHLDNSSGYSSYSGPNASGPISSQYQQPPSRRSTGDENTIQKEYMFSDDQSNTSSSTRQSHRVFLHSDTDEQSGKSGFTPQHPLEIRSVTPPSAPKDLYLSKELLVGNSDRFRKKIELSLSAVPINNGLSESDGRMVQAEPESSEKDRLAAFDKKLSRIIKGISAKPGPYFIYAMDWDAETEKKGMVTPIDSFLAN
ncbi:hypothetical protein H4R33_003091 [Dimargaris cristalligena]|nr:hypothetical protein H4R33_003091 [Dimargaris cristalligena]